MTFSFVDLCCGIGAFHIALKKLGGECVLACDKDSRSKQVYLNNFGKDTPWVDDLNDIKRLPNHDVLCAGFPCQPFSTAGKMQGINDELSRGKVIYKILKLLSETKKKPKLVVLENVAGIRIVDDGKVLTYIAKKLKSLGYNVRMGEYDAKDFGSPISRRRILIFGTRGVQLDDANEPKPKNKRHVLADIMEKGVKDVTHPSKYKLLPREKWSYTPENKIFVGYTKEKTYPGKDLSKISSHRQGFRIYHMDGCCETFTSKHKYYVYIPRSNKVRPLTSREMYRCMGFPESFKIHEARSVATFQISNSVNLYMLKPILKWVVGECKLYSNTNND